MKKMTLDDMVQREANLFGCFAFILLASWTIFVIIVVDILIKK